MGWKSHGKWKWNENGMEMGEDLEKEMEPDGNGTGISQTLLKNYVQSLTGSCKAFITVLTYLLA